MERPSDVDQRVVEGPQNRKERQNAEPGRDEPEEGNQRTGQRDELDCRESGDAEKLQYPDP